MLRFVVKISPSPTFPEFVAKTESERDPLPRSFLVRSLLDFIGDFPEERVLCPIRAVWIYMDLTKDLSPRPHSLFVSPWRLQCSISKNAFIVFHPPGNCGCWSLHRGFIASSCSQRSWCRCFGCVSVQLIDLQGA